LLFFPPESANKRRGSVSYKSWTPMLNINRHISITQQLVLWNRVKLHKIPLTGSKIYVLTSARKTAKNNRAFYRYTNQSNSHDSAILFRQWQSSLKVPCWAVTARQMSESWDAWDEKRCVQGQRTAHACSSFLTEWRKEHRQFWKKKVRHLPCSYREALNHLYIYFLKFLYWYVQGFKKCEYKI